MVVVPGGRNPIKDEDRFAGLGAEALNEAERKSVVKLACEVMAEEVHRGPVMTGETAAARYVQLNTGRGEREVFGCLFLTTTHRLIREGEFSTAPSTGPRRILG